MALLIAKGLPSERRGRGAVRLAAAWLLGAGWAAAQGPPAESPLPPRYPDHRELLILIERSGEAGRPIRTPEDWRERRRHILLGLQEVMGPFGPGKGGSIDPRSERPRAEFEVKDTSAQGPAAHPYLRKKIFYRSERDDRVPAWLLVPTGLKGRAPGILCLHQTTPIGKDEPAGLGGKENLRYAQELAERGFVALAPDYPNFGEHPFDTYARGYRSGSMKAIEDNVRGVDLLVSLDEVDPRAIGSIGHSLGGHNALFTALFDERIGAVVTCCGFTAFERYYGGDLKGWSSKTYLPRIPAYVASGGWRGMPFDFHEVVAGIAPRPVLVVAPERDSNFDIQGVREVVERAGAVYRLLGAERGLELHTPDCEHDFPPAERASAYAFLEARLRR